MSSKRFAFVVPRYFEGIAGGAETLMGNLASRLRARGDQVELWSTCAKDNRTWNNELPEGSTVVEGMPLRRFPVDRRDLDVWIPIQRDLHEGRSISPERQLLWMSESVNSRKLYAHIARHSREFDALFFGPYLFGTTFWGSLIDPSRSVLIPCLHDESYAYQSVIASMFRQVKGCLFNAEPEMHFARALYGNIPGDVVGMGFSPQPCHQIESLEPYLADGAPYILYLGRKETGKNVDLLIDYFVAAKEARLLPQELRLVILGGGSFEDLHRPKALLREDVIDLPHLQEMEKQRLLRHALALCQPSTNESFSIVIMEAWMVRAPVLVHGACPVTRHHVERAQGGLYFSSMEEFAGVVTFLNTHPDVRRSFATSGASYVEREYSWSSVLERFDKVMNAIFSEEGHRAVANTSEATTSEVDS